MPIDPRFPSLFDIRPPKESVIEFSVPQFDPSNKLHAPQLQAIQQGIVSNGYNDEEISKFVQKNPQIAPLIMQAVQARDANRKRQQVFERNFQPAVAPDPLSAGQIRGALQGANIVDASLGNPIQPADASVTERLRVAEQGQKEIHNLPRAITELNRIGDVETAHKLFQQQKTQSEAGPIGKIDPSKFDSASVDKFKSTGRYSDLVPNENLRQNKNDSLNHAKNLRGEYLDLSKDFRLIRDSYGRILEASKDPSPAGDMALVFNFMKMLDPNSVVRESEYATAQNARAVPDSVRNLYNNVVNGYKLTPTQRADFVGRSRSFYDRQLADHNKLKTNYSSLAKRSGVDPSLVLIDQEIAPTDKNKTISWNNLEKR